MQINERGTYPILEWGVSPIVHDLSNVVNSASGREFISWLTFT